MDKRRLPETSPGGTLILGEDCHVTQGGEIEQRAAFVPVWTAPPGSCVGLAATADFLYTFGHAASDPAGLPSTWLYRRLQHPGGEQLLRVSSWTPFGEGPDGLAVVGTFQPSAAKDRWIFIGSTRVTDANAPPTVGPEPFVIYPFVSKLFAGAGVTAFFSAVEDGTDYTTTASGAGFVNMSFHINDNAAIRAFAPYENYLAIFFRKAIMIWQFDADPDNTLPIQTILGSGTFGLRSVLPFRNGDVLFYDPTGIRSLRARDSSGSALTVDIGSAIDELTRAAYLASGPGGDTRELSCAIIEPLSGRAWFALGDTIFVLSQYDVTKVTAWTVYKPGFQIDGMAVFNDRVYLRSGDTFYVYGSEEGAYSYEGVEAEVWLPYLDANQPAQEKQLLGLDIAARGTWEARVGYDPENLEATDLIARLVGSTYWKPRTPIEQGSGTHIGLRFRCTAPASATEPAVLSSVVVHHSLDDPEDA